MRRRPPLWQIATAHAALLLVTVVALYPVLWVLKMALAPSQAFATGASPIPTEFSIQNFVDVVGTSDADGWLFGRQLLNSIVVSFATSAVGVGLSATAAYALSRWDFPGREERCGFPSLGRVPTRPPNRTRPGNPNPNPQLQPPLLWPTQRRVGCRLLIWRSGSISSAVSASHNLCDGEFNPATSRSINVSNHVKSI